MNSITGNRLYKDRLFVRLFGSSDRVRDALDLYNAVNGTEYTNTDDLEFFTIESVVYMSMKNDVALCMESILNLFEHQSTVNPNMPVRGLLYYGKLYSKYIEKNSLNIYSRELVKLPTPRYFVFYNGTEERPEREELLLTSAFAFPEKSSVEVKATVLNINSGKNRKLMEKCRTLSDYSEFVRRVRVNMDAEDEMGTAIDKAVDSCIRDGVLADFLAAHRAEVKEMVLTEYNETRHMELVAKEAEERGRIRGEAIGEKRGQIRGEAIGEKRGGLKMLVDLVNDGSLNIETAAQKAGMSEDEFRRAASEYTKLS